MGEGRRFVVNYLNMPNTIECYEYFNREQANAQQTCPSCLRIHENLSIKFMARRKLSRLLHMAFF